MGIQVKGFSQFAPDSMVQVGLSIWASYLRGYPRDYRGHNLFHSRSNKVVIAKDTIFLRTILTMNLILGDSSSNSFLPVIEDQPQFNNPWLHLHFSQPPISSQLDALTTVLSNNCPFDSSNQPVVPFQDLPTVDDSNLPPWAHPMMTKVQSGIQKPNPKYLLQIFAQPPVPLRVAKALDNPTWKAAMIAEYEALVNNHMWDLVFRILGQNILSCHWLIKNKLYPDRSPSKRKAGVFVNGMVWIMTICSRW